MISLLFQTSSQGQRVACLGLPWLAACPPKQPCSVVPGQDRSEISRRSMSTSQPKKDGALCDITSVSFRCCPNDQQKVLAVLVPLKLRSEE